MRSIAAGEMKGEIKFSSVTMLPATMSPDSNLVFPPLVTSSFSLSTGCLFQLFIPPSRDNSASGFSSLSSMGFQSFTAHNLRKDAATAGEGKSSQHVNPVATLVSALQSFLGSEKFAFHLIKVKSSQKYVSIFPDSERGHAGSTFIEQARGSLAFKKDRVRLMGVRKESSRSDGSEKYVMDGRSLQTSAFTVNQIGLANFNSQPEDDNELESHGIDQEGKRYMGDKAINVAKQLVAGAMSTIVSRTAVAPLERLKLEYIVRGAKDNWGAVIQQIWKAEAFGGFWKGNMVNLLRMVPFKSINFLAYDECCKHFLEKKGKDEVSNLDRLAAGAASGAVATVTCLPLDTIRTRLIAPGGEELGGMLGCLQHMIRREGFLSLYKGFLPALLSMAPSGAVFYGVYDILKAAYLQSPKARKELQSRIEMEYQKQLIAIGRQPESDENRKDSSAELDIGPVRTLFYGAIAGACAEIVTYPLEVVRRQLQLQETATKMGLLATFQGIVERDGLRALFAGVIPSTLQVLPSAALSYLIYESMKVTLKVT